MGLRNRLISCHHMTGGGYVDGLWTGQTQGEAFTIRCSVQPLSPDRMLTLPEGRRELRGFTLFTSTQMLDVGSQNPDRCTIEGLEFEVFSCDAWQNGILNHYEVTVTQVQETAAAV